MKDYIYCSFFALLLVGCTATIPVELENRHNELIPKQWNSQAMAQKSSLYEAPELWWRRWDNDTLIKLIQTTLLNNTDIAQALSSLRSVQASLTKASYDLWPSASVGINASNQWQSWDLTKNYSAEASSQWSFSFGGRDLALYNAAKANVQSKALTLVDTQNAVVSEVVKTYILLCQSEAQIRLLEQTIQSYEEARKLTQWRYQAGLVSELDVEQASAAYHSAKAQIQVAEHSKVLYQTALSHLTVLPLKDIKSLPLGSIPRAPSDLAVAIPAEVISSRADVLAAREAVIAALYNVRAAQADFFPSLSLTGTIGTTAVTVGALGASGSGIGALIAALSMPILNWGDTISATEIQKAQLDSVQALYTETIISALEEVENALSLLQSSQLKQQSLVLAQNNSRDAARLALQQYSSGLTDYQTVLSAQRTYLNDQEAVIVNQSQLAQAYVELYRTLGGGWVPVETKKE